MYFCSIVVHAFCDRIICDSFSMRTIAVVSRYIILFTMALSLPMATAEDFQKTYDDAANRRITIVVLHGDIKLSGYDGENIEISAVKKGPDRDQVEIEDSSTGNHIHIFSKYPNPARNNATVDFEIRVPKEIFYDAEPGAKPQGGRVFNLYYQKFQDDASAPQKPSPPPEADENPLEPPQALPPFPKLPPLPGVSVLPKTSPSPKALQLPHAIYLKSNSGRITISDVAGSMRLEGRNIEVQNVEGTLYAFSTSGDIKGVLKQVSHRSMLQFSSSSGNISVQAPDDISAQVRIQSSTGQVNTDFPLETRDIRYGSGKFIQGRLGDGNHMIDIRSLSGAITFSKKPSETKSK